MNNFFKSLVITGALLTTLALPKVSFAADCSAIYGGGESCPQSFSFEIKKSVQVPGKGGSDFKDNLSINDAKYSPSQTVRYHLEVKNTGDKSIPTITVTDRIPDFLTFVSGPGNYDSNTKTLTYTVNNLGAGKSTEQVEIVAKIADSNMLPSDQGTVCIVNQAFAKDNNGAVGSSNSSQFCVTKQVLGTQPQVLPMTKGGISTTPATGPEMLSLFALLPAGLAGLKLRKKSVKTVFKGGEK